MIVMFPVFIREKDDRSMQMCLSVKDLDVEQVDVENGEYEGWDASGRPLRIEWDNGPKLSLVSEQDQSAQLLKALLIYGKEYGGNRAFDGVINSPDGFVSLWNEIQTRL